MTSCSPTISWNVFQHTAARRRLVKYQRIGKILAGFNTQPPEGGWVVYGGSTFADEAFQHTAARRRLVRVKREGYPPYSVSTHSRPKAAGICK